MSVSPNAWALFDGELSPCRCISPGINAQDYASHGMRICNCELPPLSEKKRCKNVGALMLDGQSSSARELSCSPRMHASKLFNVPSCDGKERQGKEG